MSWKVVKEGVVEMNLVYSTWNFLVIMRLVDLFDQIAVVYYGKLMSV
jgi:hypothetical protein